MKKRTIVITFIILILLGLGWFVMEKREGEKLTLSDTTEAPTTTVTLDYAKLTGKDRLYTEEEGKYANLSEEKKKLLRVALTDPDCIVSPKSTWCDSAYFEGILKLSSIVALQNNILLLHRPIGGKPGMLYKIYDLEQGKFIDNQIFRYFGTQIRSDSIVAYVAGNLQAQYLLYYRPGMVDFAPIPKSELPSDESYWYRGGMGSTISEVSFVQDTMKISVFVWNNIEMEKPKKLREVTFDLSTLP